MPRRSSDACAIALLIAIVAGFQIFSGAYHSDFSFDEDEPAHAVSSLFVYDYVAAGFPRPVLPYAENYYIHYPKVGIGHWPPLFYASEAAWLALFGRARGAMIAFNGLCGVLLLASVYLRVRRDYGVVAGLLGAIALAAPAFMQYSFESATPNAMLGLFAFWSALAFEKYWNSRRPRDLILFICLAVAAIGIHGRGAVLLLLPFTVLALAQRKWTPPRIAMLIGAAAAILILPKLLRQVGPLSSAVLVHQAVSYPLRLGIVMGWPVLALALIGAFFTMRAGKRGWTVISGLAICGWIFHAVLNAGWADHYLITAAPAIAALAGAGLHFCGKFKPLVAIAACAGVAWVAFPLQRKIDLGYHNLPADNDSIQLVAGNPIHEGAFIAEMALRDRHLNRIVLRGSKVLSSSTWLGQSYKERYSTTEDVLAALDRMRVESVLLETLSTTPHVAMLGAALRSSPQWREVRVDPAPLTTLIFRRTATLPPGDPSIQIDMRHSLGRTLHLGN